MSLGESGLERLIKLMRKREFLDEMNLVVPLDGLVSLIAAQATAPGARGGHPPFAEQTMLRIHFLKQCCKLSNPAMEEALYNAPMVREFTGLDAGEDKLPDESSILQFSHMVEAHDLSKKILTAGNTTLAPMGLLLKSGTMIDATRIDAQSSTMNTRGELDPDMHQTKKGNGSHFGMKSQIGVDAESGLMHTVKTTSTNLQNITQASAQLHANETDVFVDPSYRGVHKRDEVIKDRTEINWYVAMMPSNRKALDKDTPIDAIMEAPKQTRARTRAKVGHPSRDIKLHLGHEKLSDYGLAKNTVAHVVCAVQHPHGPLSAFDGVAGMSAPANVQRVANRAGICIETDSQVCHRRPSGAARVSSRCGELCADLS